ncbi:MAG: putative HTH-type transcriptional regulator [Candidatus Woesearchaeota archaeon]|nr:putative HTH-type transcriptional regulator [Candidatus Woesearchaeota archaeon]
MDNKDWKIINELKQNSRATIRGIAKRTKIRPSTVHSRMKKLKQENIIEKYTIKLNNKKTGQGFIVWVWIKTNGEIRDSIFNNEIVKEVFGITGEYDLVMKLKCRNIEAFNKFIHKFRQLRGVQSTLTMVATSAIKEEI